MAFEIVLGLPEVRDFWVLLEKKKQMSTITPPEETIRKKWGNTMAHLSLDPFYPGLHSHEISELTQRYGIKVFQSYLENHNSSAFRMYWVYGLKRKQIVIIGIEPHPEDKKNGGYDKVKLSSLPGLPLTNK
jgi:hypothetical protein